MSFFENTRKPVGFGGKTMVAMMNSGHRAMADWGLQHLAISEDAAALDVGCGGGANIKKLLTKCSKGTVKGIDYSEISKDDKWVEKIGGMIIYNAVQILNALNEAGFSNAHVNKNEKGWICVTATK